MSRKLQYQLADGSWTDATDRDGSDRTQEFLNAAAQFGARRIEGGAFGDAEACSRRGFYGTIESVQQALSAGREVTHGEYWHAKIRLTPMPRAARAAAAHAFTCTHCGSHRDTTIAGQCDDCEANR